MQYAWLIWSLLLLVVWGIVYTSLSNKESKKEMILVSFWTSLLGLTEPLFVPEYWNPPSLFNLAEKTGFDIESIIFAFGIGGLAVVIYEQIFNIKHVKINIKERHKNQHKYHFFALISAPVVFTILFSFTKLNPIYSTIIALLAGGIFTWYCRPDLAKKMVISGLIITALYFIYFLTLVTAYPTYVSQVWNMSKISGVLIAGVPIEELLFAFSLGFLWSSVYEHIMWRRLIQK